MKLVNIPSLKTQSSENDSVSNNWGIGSWNFFKKRKISADQYQSRCNWLCKEKKNTSDIRYLEEYP